MSSKSLLLLLCCIGLLLTGCSASAPQKHIDEDALDLGAGETISSAQELLAFFEHGGTVGRLSSDIDLGEEMLKLSAQRGGVEIDGDGHTLSSNAACVVRLEDGAELALYDITVSAAQSGIGFLGDGMLLGEFQIMAQANALHGEGAITIGSGSDISLTAQTGSGVLCVGFTLEEDSKVAVEAAIFGLSAGKGDIWLQKNSGLECAAQGDNVVKNDGMLRMEQGASFQSTNTGDHNAAKVGMLEIDPAATVALKGGDSGVGLFVVEQFDDITIHGSCTPEVRVEVGKGQVAFES